MSRTTRGDSLIGYEFMRISGRGDTLVFVAQPSNQAPAEFIAPTQRSRDVILENPTHDFPQHIRYRAVGSDSLLAQIEGLRGGEPQRIEFHYARGACPSAPR